MYIEKVEKSHTHLTSKKCSKNGIGDIFEKEKSGEKK